MLGNKTGVLIDEFVFTGAFFNAETEHQVAELDNTTFGALAASAEPGLASDRLMLRGYYSGYAAGEVYRELRVRMGASGRATPVAILIDTDDTNCIAECSPDAWGQSLKVSLAAPELITFEMHTPPAGNMCTGLRMADGTSTIPGQSAPIDMAAAGTGGMMFLFVRAIAGTATNAVIKIQSAITAGGTYTDRGTITFSAVGGYAVALTAPVDRYVRYASLTLGGATSITFALFVCIKGVTY